ncbi:MAG: ribonuclease H-like domain-containing protein [Candidatus Taylorbacteria bacterium]|nr:ribonuclease H-like domain-containing protein [Candidatus Taylorbacteria bacterium]
MRKIVFDIETKNFFDETGSNDPASLDIAVVCIHDSMTDAYTSYFEKDLGKLWPLLEKTDILIGFNSDHFDIPLLDKYYSGDLTKIKSVDILKEVKKSLGRRIKLDTLAEATLGRKKTADGLLAARWWKDGLHEKVRDYCIEDVRITKDIYDYAMKNGHLKYKDGKVLKEIPLNTSQWEAKPEAVLTHTLPF